MGHLSLLIGCMFAQKTTELLRRIRRYKSIGYNVLVINHSSDTRYGSNQVISHDQLSEEAISANRLEEVDEKVRSGKYKVVAIDEGQFFTDLYQYVTAWADELDIHIVIVGLDGTSERKPFGDLLRLIPHAEEVERLSAFCSKCRDGTVATYSKYVGDTIKKDKDVIVGASELYQPVCRRHYLDN
jgi:thymidine kinase